MIRALAALVALASVAACDLAEERAQAPEPSGAAPTGSSGAPPADPYPGPPTPIAHPPGGSYAKVQYVILAASEPGEILYTTDGSAPVRGAPGTRSGRNPIFWIRVGAGTTTLTWFAVDDAGNRGPTAAATYEVTLP